MNGRSVLQQAGISEKSALWCLLWSFLTLSLYGWISWLPYRVRLINTLLGRRELRVSHIIILSILTCGLLLIYFNYKQGMAIVEIQRKYGMPQVNENLPLISAVVTALGFFIVIDFLHHDELNYFFELPISTIEA